MVLKFDLCRLIDIYMVEGKIITLCNSQKDIIFFFVTIFFFTYFFNNILMRHIIDKQINI